MLNINFSKNPLSFLILQNPVINMPRTPRHAATKEGGSFCAPKALLKMETNAEAWKHCDVQQSEALSSTTTQLLPFCVTRCVTRQHSDLGGGTRMLTLLQTCAV